jgi:uncharacterized protein (TIGR03000 family)
MSRSASVAILLLLAPLAPAQVRTLFPVHPTSPAYIGGGPPVVPRVRSFVTPFAGYGLWNAPYVPYYTIPSFNGAQYYSVGYYGYPYGTVGYFNGYPAPYGYSDTPPASVPSGNYLVSTARYAPTYGYAAAGAADVDDDLAPGTARISLDVPAGAEVQVQGQPLEGSGTHRVFVTPALSGPGEYDVVVRWKGADGQQKEYKHTVPVRPGTRSSLRVMG